MKITEVLHVAGVSGSYNKDMVAIRSGAEPDGFIYRGKPVTPGFRKIVQPGGEVSVMLRLEDGQVGFGDCTDVIFAGAAGRDRLFVPAEHAEFLDAVLPAMLNGRDASRFRPLAEEIERTVWRGQRLHTALRYGISQALLHAAALARHVPMARVIADEYGCKLASRPLPMLVSSPTNDWLQLDQRILKRVELLPHSSFTQVERHIGLRGEKLIDYAQRVVRRIGEIGEPGYRPIIHLDVYGTLGELFANDVARIAGYLGELQASVRGLDLMVESPIIAATQPEQIRLYAELCAAVRRAGFGTQIIVDEWCNTLEDVRAFSDAGAGDLLQIKTPDLGGIGNSIEAVLYARREGLGVSLGGSLNETDQSAKVTAHIGLACDPTYIYAKPGPGGDAGLMIMANEMLRTLALLR
jgi:methylaspartate ammonia-lyase